MIKYLENENEFNELIAKENILVDFYADWCGPCQMLLPHLETFSENHKEITILKVNVDKFKDIAISLNIYSIPALFYYKDGKLQNTGLGYMNVDSLENLVKRTL